MTSETVEQLNFEQRKRDHIQHALDPSVQTKHLAKLDLITLEHEALPELNFDEVSIETTAFGQNISSPLFISSMTAGHADAVHLNRLLAETAANHNILMGVGSQRRELFDSKAAHEWRVIRQHTPTAKLMGNIGLSQLIETPIDQIKQLCENLEAVALIVHCNALQEVIQPEGTPHFKGGLNAIETLCKQLPLPVIIKETGNGFSISTLNRLNQTGIYAVDLAGTGGTHWGRIEGKRAQQNSIKQRTAETFKDWGIATVDTLIAAQAHAFDFQIWGSGGIRNGLDVAKMLALGASMTGMAKPFLEHALESEKALNDFIEQTHYELNVSLFCTGCKTITQFQEKKPWL